MIVPAADSLVPWLLATSVQLLWLLPCVLWFDRFVGPRLSPEQRALPWWCLLLLPFVPSPVQATLAVVELPAPALTAGGMASWLAVGWGLGALTLAGAGGVAHARQVRTLLASTQPAGGPWQQTLAALVARAGSTSPRLLQGGRGAGPCVLGLWRPRIVIPAELANAGAAVRSHVLAHELAHVRRRDGVRAVPLVLIAVVLWFHPVVWFAVARLRTLREMACDAAAVRATGGDFAATLRACVRSRLLPGAVPAMVGTVGELRARLTALQRPAGHRRTRQWPCTLAMLAALCACCVPVAAVLAPPPPLASGALPGCLQQRFLVFAALAQEAEAAAR